MYSEWKPDKERRRGKEAGGSTFYVTFNMKSHGFDKNLPGKISDLLGSLQTRLIKLRGHQITVVRTSSTPICLAIREITETKYFLRDVF